ncbi:MAG: hypothetical protein ACE5FF_06435 [Saprospiraceae bacterium]
MKINIVLTFALAALLQTLTADAIAQQTPLDISLEFQAYPTGLLPGLRVEKGFGTRHTLHLRAGYNLVRHGSAGKHEDERGGGAGFTIGYKRYFSGGFRGWFAGVKNDFWLNEIDWKDGVGQPGESSGTTNITVVQPTAEAGFLFEFGRSWIFAPTLAFGFEINVKTKGEPTGEGAIFLAGLQFGRRF